MNHNEPHPLSGRTVRIKPGVKHPQFPDFGGSEYRIEDWWDRVAGKSWRLCEGNPACLIYGVRAMARLPMDDEVVYGKVGHYGHLVHVSELEEEKP